MVSPQPAAWSTGKDRVNDDSVYGLAVAVSLATIVLTAFLSRYVHAAIAWLQAGRLLRRQFPSPPVDNIIAGHAVAMQSPKNHRWLSDTYRQLGPLFYVRLAHNHVVFVSDPALLPVMFDRALYPPNANILDRPVEQFLVQMDAMTSDSGHSNLLTDKTGSDLWRLVRKGVAPAFNPQNIRQGFTYVLEAVDQLMVALKERGSERAVDMDDAAQRVSMEVIGKVGFGKSFGAMESLDHPAEGDAFKVIATGFEEVAKRLSNPVRKYMLWDGGVRKGNAAFKAFHQIIRNLLREVQSRGPPSEDDPTIAGHLLRLRDQKGQPLSDDRLHAEFSAMFIGGTDTSGHTIANTLYFISQHPEAERKVEAELDSLGFLVTSTRKDPKRMEYADLSKLLYLSGAIKESMRMMAVVGTGVGRVVNEQMQLGKHTIPKGTILWAPIQAIQSSPTLWHKPDSFMLERWLEEDAEFWKGPANASASSGDRSAEVVRGRRYLPFGDGVRSCVGQSLAKMNYTATLALLLSHFSFRLADRMGGAEGVAAAEMARITVAPKDGMWMHAVPRG